MTRADFRTLAWLGPVALVLGFWWIFRADPCLDDTIRNHLRAMNPPPAAVSPAGGSEVVVENPYGIETCDYWPDATDHAITLGILAVIAMLIGFLSAWKFAQRARVRAVAITFMAVFLAAIFSLLMYLPDHLSYFERFGYELLLKATALMMALALGAATVAGFAAWMTQSFRTRA